MGAKKQKALIRAVLDTNTLVSAFLFGGEASSLATLWKTHITPVLSRATFDEFVRVLSYPKFGLTEQEISAIINDELLPWCDVVSAVPAVHGVCSDSDDDMFLACAASAGAKYIVSGDKHLLELGKYKNIKIIDLRKFIEYLKKHKEEFYGS